MAYQPLGSPYAGNLVPDTPPTGYSATSANGSPVSITLPSQFNSSQPGHYAVGLDTIGGVWGPGPAGWPALVIMAPSPIRPFAAGEAITLTDASNNIIAIRNAKAGTAALAYLPPGGTYTATASGWSGGAFTVEFIGQNATIPSNPAPYYGTGGTGPTGGIGGFS